MAPWQPWILSRRDDLVWFQGSVLAGVSLLIFFRLAPPLNDASYTPGHPALLAVLLWGVLCDGTHVWATYARSYCAPDDASRAGLPGRWSWGLLAIGPAVAFLDGVADTMIGSRPAGPNGVFRMFLLGAYVWAYWHLVRQHYGFLMLYRKRAGEHDPRGVRLDSLVLWTGCLYPFLRFALSPSYLMSGLPHMIPAPWLASTKALLDLAFGLVMLVALGFVGTGRIEPLRPGPKHLFLAIVISFHLLVFGLLENLLTILATLTVFHNVQYHRIVWQYERGLGRTPSGGLIPYLALGLTLGVVWYVPRVLGVAALHPGLARNVLIGLCWGVAFHHYLVDGRIWRVRRSTVVSRALDAGAVRA